MSDYYSVTVKVSFGVLANSIIEAEELAKEFCPIEDAPRRANITYDAYLTPNQTDRLKSEAANI